MRISQEQIDGLFEAEDFKASLAEILEVLKESEMEGVIIYNLRMLLQAVAVLGYPEANELFKLIVPFLKNVSLFTMVQISIAIRDHAVCRTTVADANATLKGHIDDVTMTDFNPYGRTDLERDVPSMEEIHRLHLDHDVAISRLLEDAMILALRGDQEESIEAVDFVCKAHKHLTSVDSLMMLSTIAISSRWAILRIQARSELDEAIEKIGKYSNPYHAVAVLAVEKRWRRNNRPPGW